ncbi:hypothetical protein DSCO28_70950 [Desulfosarcina ovata subsp. sediminis]|uniref:PEP-CTERM protein-sorting domain-containing protein n=1 Tax=Desulfosarcina ovata subsp. sediminis TaxID=885957 RepID=A0A5K8A1U1_9BACT|nr:hypothetical protein [Desulfosarcina ovata]BBO86529.1 hypothetical protein DSCO28_70950 [Desulfosarcina ovata subsp. sediminis]
MKLFLKSVFVAFCLLITVTGAQADTYSIQGGLLEVDYWAGSGSNDLILVIDWNETNGPYETPTHAFGYSWDGDATLEDALIAIDAAGALEVTGTDWINYINYDDGTDSHSMETPTNYNGWLWHGYTTDFGETWTANSYTAGGVSLIDGYIQAINIDKKNWTSSSLNLPTAAVPVPAAVWLLGSGLIGLLGIRCQSRK